jgi:hypothetical protein
MNELEVIPQAQPQEIARREITPLSVTQVQSGLRAIHEVMRDCMKEGQDFGKVPGCGDKPGLFQPGAQKLSMMFQLNPEVRQETISDYPNYHRGFRLIVRVTNGGKFADGVGECSTLESKYRYRNAGKKCPECGKETIIKGKAEYGGGWLCFEKKGGCGWKCNDGTPAAEALQSQAGGKVEHDNAPDFWNTVRKMAFKRAFVHAIINATNTSELWSQDLEDLAANGVVTGSPAETPEPPTRQSPPPPKRPESSPRASGEASGVFPDSDVATEAMFDGFEQKAGKSKKSGKPYVLTTMKFTDENERKFEVTTFDGDKDKLDVLVGCLVTVKHKPDWQKKGRELINMSPVDGIM